MAERRMFAKSIVQSGKFLKMPLSTQALYFQLGMCADDDGVVEAWQVMKMLGAAEDELRVLVAKNLVQVLNEDYVAYLTDWDVNNKIRKDRYHKGVYKDLKLRMVDGLIGELTDNDNQMTTKWQPNDNQMATEDRLGKDRLGEDSKGKDSIEKNNSAEAEKELPPAPEEYADVEAIIFNDGSEWKPTKSLYEEYVRLYPAVNIKNEFRKIRAWCIANPKRRKTRGGVMKFVNTWLSKEQDSPRLNNNYNNREDAKRRFVNGQE